MAIAFRLGVNEQTGVTCNKPTGTVSGDVMVAHLIDEGNHTITPPSGWTQIDNQLVTSGSSIRAASFYKVAGGSEPSSYTWTITGHTYTEIDIISYSGVDNTTPINAHNIVTAPSSPTTAVPNVTTTVANCMLSIGCNEWFGHGWVSADVTGYTLDSGISTSNAWDLGTFHKAVTTATTYGGELPAWNNGNGGNFKSVTVVARAPASGATTVSVSAAATAALKSLDNTKSGAATAALK